MAKEFVYNEKKNYGKVGTEKAFTEVSVGKYNDYSEKVYLVSKYTTKAGETKTSKSFGLTKLEWLELLPMLLEAVHDGE